MKTLLIILVITTVAVNCGLLKDLVQPVTDNVHKSELFNQKEQKQDGKETKGVLDKIVNDLDAGADKLVNALTSSFNIKGLEDLNKDYNYLDNKNKTKVDEKPDVGKIQEANSTEKLEDVKKVPEGANDLTDKITTTTLSAVDKVKIKTDDITTPKVEIKPEEEVKKLEEVKAEEKKPE